MFTTATDEVVNRIFNHKPFLEAEIRTMVKDFEEEAKHRTGDIDQMLDSAYERMKDVKDTQIECVQDFCDIKLPPLIDRVEQIEEQMNSLLKMEATKKGERKERLDQFITKENESLIQFMQQMDERIKEIDSSYEKKREEVHQKYSSKTASDST